MDDWRLRNRIRAFILLIQRSAFRESLKGQDQLHIDPLMDLVDRFHTHEATDIRDKIYALWGLSTESELTNTLRPDYNKSWKSLLADLGLHVFGKDSELTPSESKQMLYVRCLCYYLGKVVSIYDAEMWDMEQRLEIASVRVSKLLDHDYTYNLTLKMRSSAQRIGEQDIVCFLPRTKNLIFARPESRFLRIISIIECRSVQISQHNYKNPDTYWRSWQPFLNSIGREMVRVPFLWSWEQNPVHEGQEIWCLIRNHSSSSILKARDDAQQALELTVLSEVAALHMQMDNYAWAYLNLNTVVNDYSSEHGQHVDGINDSRKRLDIALKRRSMYDKAKNILASQRHFNVDAQSPGVFVLCFHVIFHAGLQLVLSQYSEQNTRRYVHLRSKMRFTAAHILEFAAVIMSRGVRKNMLRDAIKMCKLGWGNIPYLTVRDYEAIDPKNLLKDAELLPLMRNPHHDYLGFLLQMSDQNLCLSNRELSEAFRADISARDLNQLLKHCETTFDNLPDLIALVWDRTERDKYHNSAENFLRSVLKGNADRVSITYDAILYALKLDNGVVRVLLEAAQERRGVAPGTLDDLVRNYLDITPKILNDFASVVETECHIGESALLERFGYDEPLQRVREDLLALWGNDKITVDITEPVLGAFLDKSEEIISFIMYRQDPSILNGKIVVAKYARSNVSRKRMLSNLRLLEEGARPIEKGHAALTIPNSVRGYAQLLNLVRHRREEFEITPDLFIRTVQQPAVPVLWAGPLAKHFAGPFAATEEIGRCLVRYTDDKEIDALTKSSEVLNVITLGGYVPIMEEIRNRVSNVSPLFEVFSQVAIWSRATKVKDSVRQYHGSQAHRELIKSLGTMFVPPQLQRTLLKLACGNLDYTEKYDVLEDILSRNIVKAVLSSKFQETILHLVLWSWTSPTALNMLLEHKVIGANTAFEDGSTTLHLIFDWYVRGEAERVAKNVDIMMQHGGAASIDAKNARGETPRKMAKEILKREKKGGNHRRCEYFSEILRIFDKMAPTSQR